MPRKAVTLDEFIRGIKPGTAIVVEVGVVSRFGTKPPRVRSEDPRGLVHNTEVEEGINADKMRIASNHLIENLTGSISGITLQSARDVAERVIDVSEGLDHALAKEWVRIRFFVRE